MKRTLGRKRGAVTVSETRLLWFNKCFHTCKNTTVTTASSCCSSYPHKRFQGHRTMSGITPRPSSSQLKIDTELVSNTQCQILQSKRNHPRFETFLNLQTLFTQETSLALQRLSKVLIQRVDQEGRRREGEGQAMKGNGNTNPSWVYTHGNHRKNMKYMQHPQHQQQPSSLSNQKYEMATLLQKFYNPQKPPLPSSNSSSSTTQLFNLQLWYECQSQQESVLKIQDMLQSAKARQDYISLPIMKQHLLTWYHPLRQRIETEQRMYLSGQGTKQGKVDFKRYGPFLCTIQPEKLAILTIHEAIYTSLSKGGGGKTHNNIHSSIMGGVTVTQMALRIGDVVEAELNVQRALKSKVMMKSSSSASTTTTTTTTSHDHDTTTTTDHNKHTPTVSTSSTTNIDTNSTSAMTDTWMYSGSHLQQFMDEIQNNNNNNNNNSSTSTKKNSRALIRLAHRRARKLIDSPEEEWTTAEKVKLGSVLIQMLLETTRVIKDHDNGKRRKGNMEFTDLDSYLQAGEPAFTYEKQWMGEKKLVGRIVMNPWLYRACLDDKFESLEGFTSRYQPMIVPPRPWKGIRDGGYYALNVDLMRTHGCRNQRDALREADLSTVLNGLNVLGRVPWKVNKDILAVAKRCWDEGIPIGDIPSRKDFELPPEPIPIVYDSSVYKDKDHPAYKVATEEYRAYCEAKIRYKRVRQKNMDLISLRCSALLKLNQAEKFKDFAKIYFPYNLDFRGRSYPVPPHLSNIGSDLCRGMLMFAESKPLGYKGLFWLKVHVANLAGKNKMSFEDRAKFTEDNMKNIRECVNDPFGENRWWIKSLEDPFQGLAACNEIIRAIDSGDPSTYECNLPVHMDGSCNGLQHYAALGRDKVGGKAVNLCDYEKPQDVYIGVMVEVIRRVAEEAAKEVPFDVSDVSKLSKAEKEILKSNRAAKLVNGLIDRGVVKRTVMTSVYGVTFIGARKQIQEKIEEKLEGKGYDVDEIENEVHAACGYLARVTMEVIGELFTGAKQTMGWLSGCARLIASQGQPVTWMSAVGVPAVQPYRQKKPYTVVTLLQSVILMDNSDNLPIHKQRQVSAFPPNYVHSLDSSHMLLTALEMDRRALTFSAVHDSFWTHACDVDEMNQVLRDCFVDLYSRPLLEELKKTWELQYPSLQFPELPAKGELDLTEVKRAKFFFQ